MPWFLIAIVVGTGVWMAFDYAGRPRAVAPVVERTDPLDPTPTVEKHVTPSATAEPSPTPTETDRRRRKKKDRAKPLITEGITIQVLNGTNDPQAAEAMEEHLVDLGFQVVAVEATSKPYDETTVFWSTAASKEAARALAARFDWVADAKPANLADSVSLHVVVGKDADV